jgi:uncharacterized surface anchored protein
MNRILATTVTVALLVFLITSVTEPGVTDLRSQAVAAQAEDATPTDVPASDELATSPPIAETFTPSPTATADPVGTTLPTASAESTIPALPVPPQLPTTTETPEPSATAVPTVSAVPTATAVESEAEGTPAVRHSVEADAAEEILTIFTVGGQGEPISGFCIEAYLLPNYSYAGYFCDEFDDANDGVLHLSLLPGTYSLAEVVVPEGYPSYVRTEFMVVAGEPNELTITNFPRQQVTVFKVDENGQPLTDDQGGACFYLSTSEGSRLACDGDDGVNDGKILQLGTVGTYELSEARAPDGYVAGFSQAVTIVGDGPNEFTVTNVPAETVTVYKIDAQGARLTDTQSGACFSIYSSLGYYNSACDASDGANDGTITLLAVPGANTLREDSAPLPYGPVEPQAVTIIAGGANEFTVVNGPLEPLTVHDLDEHGHPLPGACFTIFSWLEVETCDADDGADDGTTTLYAGAGTRWYVQQTRVPAGYYDAPGQWVDIVAGGPDEVTFANIPLDTLTIYKVNEHGDPLAGACFRLEYSPDTAACDADDGADDGTITLRGLDARFGGSVEEYQAPAGYAPTRFSTYVELVVGGPNEVTITNLPAEPVTVFKVDENGDPLTDDDLGTCFFLSIYGDTQTSESEACDADDGVNDGTITLMGIPGYGILEEWRWVKGYAPNLFDDVVKVVAGGPNEVTVTNHRLATLTVLKVDENGDPLPGACFAIPFEFSCDSDDGADDGTIVFEDTDPGILWLEEEEPPPGYSPVEPREVKVTVDGPNVVTVVNLPDETLTIHKVDEQGRPITDDNVGACFEIIRVYFDLACDADDGANDGVILLQAPPGKGTLREGHAPDGYFPGEPQEVMIIAGGPNEFTVANVALEELTIFAVNEEGEPLLGDPYTVCFYIHSLNDERTISSACDGDNDAIDGMVTLTAPPGRFVIREYSPPQGYWASPAQKVTIVRGGPNEFTFVNLALQPLTIHKVDSRGQPVIGACFRIDTEDFNFSEACDEYDANDGTIILGVRPGTFVLKESHVPPGYVRPKPQEITVIDGTANEITIVNLREGETPVVTPSATSTLAVSPTSTPPPSVSPTPGSPDGTAVGGVQTLPSTGARPIENRSGKAQTLLLAVTGIVLIAAAVGSRRRTTRRE